MTKESEVWDGEDMGSEDRIPWIICTGANGRCVVFGWLREEPQVGVPVTMYDARMVLEWPSDCVGLFGLSANGPKEGTRLTPVVKSTINTPQQGIMMDPDVGRLFDEWPAG